MSVSPSRRGLMVWSLAAGLWLLPVAAAAGSIYGYVDEKGVMHFTNVPIDSRYQPLAGEPPRKATRPADPSRYEPLIRAAARHFQVDPLLVKAVIKTESCFDRLAVSKKGAQGLMQLMPETAHDMRVLDPFDAEDNIRGGTRYLRMLLDLFKGDLRLSLAAYNAGPNRVREIGRVPRIPETVQYVERVLRHYRQYQAASSPYKKWVKVAYD